MDKPVGKTPLEALENLRRQEGIPKNVPMTYAGRLDPMASGKLLVLTGEACKRKEEYLALEKEYVFEVLFDAQSDTGDVLGLVDTDTPQRHSPLNAAHITSILRKLRGTLTLPYPAYSSKTIDGKPLHVWSVEGRLDEIDIPTYTATIHQLELLNIGEAPIDALYEHISQKIELVTPVTAESKKAGNDFRRPAVRAAWKKWYDNRAQETYPIAQFRCVCSSGMYMRTLANEIAKQVCTTGLAYSIMRTKVGRYQSLPFGYGVWLKQF
ncbi:hypothetical protein N9L26_01550 [Candidatus Pacebacteria bacterium]|nr:hypothetical protein [Candidatus Paceibacterota bacterium]